jgi:DNA polymerase-3 subunit delta'
VPTLGDIRGQERAIAVLRRRLELGRVPHALLFVGPAGVGKHTTALAFAAAMNCDVAPGEGCAMCASCARIAAGQHPDVVTLERQGPSATIPIEVIRGRVIPALALPPHEARARVFVIEEATSLLGPAANALLKTLEEPPARTHFVLGTASPAELLPTIRSRCQRIEFAPLGAALRAELDAGAEEAANLTAHVDALAGALEGGSLGLYRAAEALAGDKERVTPALLGLAERLHADARRRAEDGDLGGASAQAGRVRRVLACVRGLAMHNAHAQLAVEDLLHALRAQPVAR